MLSTQRDVLFLVLMSACSLGYCCNLEALLSWYKYLLFRNIYTTAGCALLGSRNGLLILLQQQPFSFRWSVLVLMTLSTFALVPYKYLLFSNAFNTAGWALLGSRDGLLDWLLQQPFSFRWSAWVLSTLSTLVMVQVSSLQECFRHSGMVLLLVLMSACSLGFISAEFLHICHRSARLF
jgi:hypothetical protein